MVVVVVGGEVVVVDDVVVVAVVDVVVVGGGAIILFTHLQSVPHSSPGTSHTSVPHGCPAVQFPKGATPSQAESAPQLFQPPTSREHFPIS